MKFKELLKNHDMTGARLGRKIGVSRALVSVWVRERGTPTTKDLLKIAEALDVSVEELLNCFKE